MFYYKWGNIGFGHDFGKVVCKCYKFKKCSRVQILPVVPLHINLLICCPEQTVKDFNYMKAQSQQLYHGKNQICIFHLKRQSSLAADPLQQNSRLVWVLWQMLFIFISNLTPAFQLSLKLQVYSALSWV